MGPELVLAVLLALLLPHVLLPLSVPDPSASKFQTQSFAEPLCCTQAAARAAFGALSASLPSSNQQHARAAYAVPDPAAQSKLLYMINTTSQQHGKRRGTAADTATMAAANQAHHVA